MRRVTMVVMGMALLLAALPASPKNAMAKEIGNATTLKFHGSVFTTPSAEARM